MAAHYRLSAPEKSGVCRTKHHPCGGALYAAPRRMRRAVAPSAQGRTEFLGERQVSKAENSQHTPEGVYMPCLVAGDGGGTGEKYMDYKSRRWKRLREKILRRDRYLCRESRRYGRIVEATTAHHVWPVEQYPEYQWCEWNLIALSGEEHNAMHDRETGELTDKGEYWRRKITPPPPTPLGESR